MAHHQCLLGGGDGVCSIYYLAALRLLFASIMDLLGDSSASQSSVNTHMSTKPSRQVSNIRLPYPMFLPWMVMNAAEDGGEGKLVVVVAFVGGGGAGVFSVRHSQHSQRGRRTHFSSPFPRLPPLLRGGRGFLLQSVRCWLLCVSHPHPDKSETPNSCTTLQNCPVLFVVSLF